jgi:hypothetical protein
MKEALLTKRETLLDELKELDATIALVRQEYSAKLGELQVRKKPLEEALDHIEALLQFEGYCVNASQPNDNATGGAGVVAETSIVDATFGLLEELHQPLHYKDMAVKLQERNVYIPGKDPAATLLSRINRDNRFKRAAKRGVYGLSTWRMRNVRPRRAKRRKTKKQ